MLKVFLPLALLAGAFPVTAAHASAAERHTAVRVPYDDLNLASRKGVATLDLRLARAIDSACDVDRSDLALIAAAAARTCRAAKQAEVDIPRDAAIARARVGLASASR